MECFVIIVNGWKPVTIITKRSILDVAAALDPPLFIRVLYIISSNYRAQKWFLTHVLEKSCLKTLDVIDSFILAELNPDSSFWEICPKLSEQKQT